MEMITNSIRVGLATEDELSEAIGKCLISKIIGISSENIDPYRDSGSGYLSSKMDTWCQMANRKIMVVLTDLDNGLCANALRQKWLNKRKEPPNLLLRVAVREIESWVIADHEALKAWFEIKSHVDPEPDKLPNPKQYLLKLAKDKAPKAIREDLVQIREKTQLRQGIGYNAKLTEWVRTKWSPERAASRSPSLSRTNQRLREVLARNRLTL